MTGIHPTADRPPLVLRRHAGTSSADADTLVGLAADDSYLVRRQAVDNPATPRWVVELLVRAGADERLRGRAAADPTLSAAELRRLVECGPFARELVAEHDNAGPDVLAEVATDTSSRIRVSVATHRSTPAAVLGRLCSDADAAVRERAAANPRRPDEVVELLVAAGAEPSLRAAEFGTADEVSADRCRMLAGLGSFGRFLAARNHGCPADVLVTASMDDALAVRSAVLEHPRVPGDVVERIAGSEVDVSALRSGPAHRLAELARHPSAAVRLAVARSMVADRAVVSGLMTDSDARVRTESVRSPFADPRLLDVLRRAGTREDLSGLAAPGAVSEDELRELAVGGPWARLLAVRHPSSAGDVLAALLADEDPKLREWAAAHPRVPRETVELLHRAGAADDLQGIAEGDPTMSEGDLREVARLGPYGAFVVAWHPSAPADLQARHR